MLVDIVENTLWVSPNKGAKLAKVVHVGEDLITMQDISSGRRWQQGRGWFSEEDEDCYRPFHPLPAYEIAVEAIQALKDIRSQLFDERGETLLVTGLDIKINDLEKMLK